jgi:4-hydroxybenzoyl-CoA reductase subunit beta
MLLPAHEFMKPASLDEGLAILARAGDGARVLGGGTDVVFNMRNRLVKPAVLLSVRGLAELQQVTERADGTLVIGAGCRLADLAAHAGIAARYPALAAAFRAVASSHVRNMATLGGNLNLDTRCWYTNQTQEWRAAKGGCLKTGVDACHVIRGASTCVAINNADTPPMLVALGAEVTLASAAGRRTLPLAGYYRPDGHRHTQLRPDELMTEVLVPPTGDRLAFIKDTARLGIDFAYGSIAARAGGRGEQATGVRLVLNSLGPAPVVLRRAAEIATQHGLTDSSIEAAAEAVREELGPLSNLYTPAAYKRELARALVRRALLALRET